MTSTLNFASAADLCRIPDPHIWSAAKSALMIAACREFAVFHAARSPEIAYLYMRERFDCTSICGENDLSRIPMLGVSAMKRFLITSLPHEQAVLKLTSSGTRGQKTQIWFDASSLERCQAMLESQWRQEGLVSQEATNYLMFVYDPEDAKDLGIAFADKNQQRFAPVHRSFYAIRKDACGQWAFRKDEVIETLRAYAAEGRPVRLFGMPAFIHEIMSVMTRAIQLPPNSWIVTGGGWKAAEEKNVSRRTFREKAGELFGLALENIRDGYGMAEHCAPYLECRKHRFHVPAFCRVLPRDPVTLAPLPPGHVGLLELIAPYNAMMPNLAILTTDMGAIEATPCPCGYNSPTFVLTGRGGIAKHKGCAISAGEIVRRR